MTPKEKAMELVDKMLTAYDIEPIAIKCAIVAVQEVIEALKINSWQNAGAINFYDKVLTEIENYED